MEHRVRQALQGLGSPSEAGKGGHGSQVGRQAAGYVGRKAPQSRQALLGSLSCCWCILFHMRCRVRCACAAGLANAAVDNVVLPSAQAMGQGGPIQAAAHIQGCHLVLQAASAQSSSLRE